MIDVKCKPVGEKRLVLGRRDFEEKQIPKQIHSFINIV